MFSLLRNRFGIPGVISVIALVFAMLGGAYAASNNGGGKATASAKAKQGPRGKTGKTGPAGPAGPAGPQGPAGAKGDAGPKGDKGDAGNAGAAGSPGAAGTSVTNTKLNPGNVNCVEGGAEFKVGAGTPTFACKGEEGPAGPPGSAGPTGPTGDPWTAGGTLPPGATETGAWAFNGTEGEEIYAPVSFAIPLAAGLSGEVGEEHVHIVPNTGGGTCEGFTNLPEAPPGELCVYTGSLSGTSGGEIFELLGGGLGGGRAGAVLKFTMTGTGHGTGSWAVTGCGNAAFPCP